jgi:hypothetical protein
MPSGWTDDDQLLAWLDDALREARAVPRDFVDTGLAAYGWRDVDAELARLVRDSADEEDRAPVGVRAGRVSRRNLTFGSARFVIEVEIGPDAVRGQIVPVRPDEAGQALAGLGPDIEMHVVTGEVSTAAIDELGYFAVHTLPRRNFRLRCPVDDGTDVVTPWIAP